MTHIGLIWMDESGPLFALVFEVNKGYESISGNTNLGSLNLSKRREMIPKTQTSCDPPEIVH